MIQDVGIPILLALQASLSKTMPEQPTGSQVRKERESWYARERKNIPRPVG
jgi:hypothetical protein